MHLACRDFAHVAVIQHERETNGRVTASEAFARARRACAKRARARWRNAPRCRPRRASVGVSVDSARFRFANKQGLQLTIDMRSIMHAMQCASSDASGGTADLIAVVFASTSEAPGGPKQSFSACVWRPAPADRDHDFAVIKDAFNGAIASVAAAASSSRQGYGHAPHEAETCDTMEAIPPRYSVVAGARLPRYSDCDVGGGAGAAAAAEAVAAAVAAEAAAVEAGAEAGAEAAVSGGTRASLPGTASAAAGFQFGRRRRRRSAWGSVGDEPTEDPPPAPPARQARGRSRAARPRANARARKARGRAADAAPLLPGAESSDDDLLAV